MQVSLGPRIRTYIGTAILSFVVECVFARLSTAEYREVALALLRLGTVAVMRPGAFYLLTSGIAVLPHVSLARADPDRIVYDPVLDRVRMDPAAEPRVPVLLL